jgi:hypothetical protein
VRELIEAFAACCQFSSALRISKLDRNRFFLNRLKLDHLFLKLIKSKVSLVIPPNPKGRRRHKLKQERDGYGVIFGKPKALLNQ